MTASLAWLFIQAERRATEIFDRHEQDVERKVGELAARDPARPPLFDPPLPGDTWELYYKASNELREMQDEISLAIPELWDGSGPAPPLDPAKIEDILRRCAPQIEGLRGSLRMEVRVTHDFEEGMRPLEFHLSSGMPDLVSGFLARAAIHRHAQGRGREALEFLAMLLGVAQDRAREGYLDDLWIQVKRERRGAFAAREIFASHSLSAQDLAELAQRLNRLDAHRPSAIEAFALEDVMARRALLNLGRTGESGRLNVPAWSWELFRFLGSRRWAVASALEDLDPYYRTIQKINRLPSHARAMEETEARERLNRNNPFVLCFVSFGGSSFGADSVGLMYRSLLRVAVAIARREVETGHPPEKLEDLIPKYLPVLPACPLTGHPFRYSPGKVWSDGGDGDDDGGVQRREEDEEGDEVFVVKRK